MWDCVNEFLSFFFLSPSKKENNHVIFYFISIFIISFIFILFQQKKPNEYKNQRFSDDKLEGSCSSSSSSASYLIQYTFSRLTFCIIFDYYEKNEFHFEGMGITCENQFKVNSTQFFVGNIQQKELNE